MDVGSGAHNKEVPMDVDEEKPASTLVGAPDRNWAAMNALYK